MAVVRWFRKKPGPDELERRRRMLIHQTGKLSDGEILDVDGLLILYSYSVAGVSYTVSQDATAIETLLPADRMSMVGPVLIKFIPRNPANSIVLCEGWNGVRNA
jgi:hypothetical protein